VPGDKQKVEATKQIMSQTKVVLLAPVLPPSCAFWGGYLWADYTEPTGWRGRNEEGGGAPSFDAPGRMSCSIAPRSMVSLGVTPGSPGRGA